MFLTLNYQYLFQYLKGIFHHSVNKEGRDLSPDSFPLSQWLILLPSALCMCPLVSNDYLGDPRREEGVCGAVVE